MDRETKKQCAVCVKNEGYAASLELHKIYQVLSHARALEHQMVRVIDESGEDYLYPQGLFLGIKLPHALNNWAHRN